MNCKFLSLVVLLAASTLYYVLRNPSEETVDAWKTATRPKKLSTHGKPQSGSGGSD
jgi:hypothetical protein